LSKGLIGEPVAGLLLIRGISLKKDAVTVRGCYRCYVIEAI
jgi:hypothetical protein